jgi:hypothetical protein
MVAPSNVRTWAPEQATLPYAEFDGNRVKVHNIRNCNYFDDETYIVNHENRSYDLSKLKAVDFIIVPFDGMPRIAHTMLSFEFESPGKPPEHIAVSIEIRKEDGEEYAAWKGGLRQYELMYVIADEQDVVKLRTNHWHDDVYLYRTTATPEQARQLFVDVRGRANELASRPEFYDTFHNNCTTNLVRHVNRIHPNRIKYDYRVMFPGYSDELAFQEGLIQQRGTFEETKAAAYITPWAIAAGDSADFSQAIRR